MSSDSQMNRRSFLAGIGGAMAAAAVADRSAAGEKPEERPGAAPRAGTEKGGIRKSLGYEMVGGDAPMVEKFKMLKEIGFEGVEFNSPNNYSRDEVIAARDASGLAISAVVNGAWKVTLSDPDPAIRTQAVKNLEIALRDAKAYGADTVLLVPGKVDKATAYDDVYKRSQESIRKALPLAKELGVFIAIENVWNNFLLSPLEAARYVDEFESPMVRWYFDVGNVVRYGWPEQWIRILGKRIARIHVKEFSRKLEGQHGPWKGFDVEIGDGDCDWPAVMKALREVGYTSGWGAAEVRGGDRARLTEIARRMDRVFAM